MTADIGKNDCGSLPIGIEDFETLRKEGRIYVDKTALIFELAYKPSKIFLPAPLQFGKSLLTSTLESLFKKGLLFF